AREKGGQDGALGQDLAGQLVQLGVGVGLHVVPLLVAPGVQGGYRMSLSRLRIEAGSSTYTTHDCRQSVSRAPTGRTAASAGKGRAGGRTPALPCGLWARVPLALLLRRRRGCCRCTASTSCWSRRQRPRGPR